jgi:tRNA-binding protein
MEPGGAPGAFSSLDIRVGRVVAVEEAQTKKPTYRLTIDFGPDIGTKVSCGGYRHYPVAALVGKLVVGVVNLPPKVMGPETSEVLVLGAEDLEQRPIYLTPASDVPVGARVF